VMGAGDGGPAGLDSSYNALFQLGLHGMAGAKKGIQAHSFMGHIAAVWLNGTRIGEIGMNCALAGSFGVPCVFVSGDWAAAQEAQALVPGIETVVVKEGLNPGLGSLVNAPAIVLSPEAARQAIRSGAEQAVSKTGKIPPWVVTPPYTMRVQYQEAKHADQALQNPLMKRINETTVESSGDDLMQLPI